MEIYNLKDEIPEKNLKKLRSRDGLEGRDGLVSRDGCSSDSESRDGCGGVLKISELKQGVKNPNRVNVFINGKYTLSLDVTQVVDYKLKVGKEISEEELAELTKASDFGKIYQRTLEWVLLRPRSVRETKDYLYKRLRKPSSDRVTGHTRSSDAKVSGRVRSSDARVPGRVRTLEEVSEISRTILDRLIEKKYLDDGRFAEWYVENRFVNKGVSQKRLKMELMKKGIRKAIIDEVLCARDDEEEIRKIIKRKRAKYNDEKLVAYLCRQGFSYDLAQLLVMEERYSSDSLSDGA